MISTQGLEHIMKGSIGGAVRMVTREQAGMTGWMPTPQYRWWRRTQEEQRQLVVRLDACAKRPINLTPRLVKK